MSNRPHAGRNAQRLGHEGSAIFVDKMLSLNLAFSPDNFARERSSLTILFSTSTHQATVTFDLVDRKVVLAMRSAAAPALLLLLLSCALIAPVEPISQPEKDSLLAIYNSLNGPAWVPAWNLNADPCTWYNCFDSDHLNIGC